MIPCLFTDDEHNVMQRGQNHVLRHTLSADARRSCEELERHLNDGWRIETTLPCEGLTECYREKPSGIDRDPTDPTEKTEVVMCRDMMPVATAVVILRK